MGKWAAVIVLFHPGPEVGDVIDSARDNCDHLMIVDNGSKDTWEPESGVELIHCGVNVGLGAAYNLAANIAHQRGFTHLLLLDQDTILLPGFRAEVECVFEARAADRVAVVGTRFRNWRDASEQSGRGSGLVRNVDMLVSSGSVLPLPVWASLGGFDESFFIDFIDIEFCLRAVRAGYDVLELDEYLMKHGMGNPAGNSFLWVSRGSSNYSALRHYYMMRNFILTAKRTGGFGWFARNLPRRLRMILLTLVMEGGRLDKFRAVLAGLRDGALGRGGQRVSRAAGISSWTSGE